MKVTEEANSGALYTVMTDNDPDPPSESGIRRFIRGILPHWTRSSPQGSATPTLNDSANAGNYENCSTNSQDLKRKSSILRNNADSDDSDYEENLPSHKRQRVTVSAMRRLFAKFSLSDKDSVDIQNAPILHKESTILSSPSSSPNEGDHTSNIPKESSESDIPALIPSLIDDNTIEENSYPTSNNNEDDIPDLNNQELQMIKSKRDSSSTEKFVIPISSKRQKTKHNGDTKESKGKCLQNTSIQKLENSNKRHAEISDSENEERGENPNKVKRTRRLRRGLRLCTNITCYIEQVIYN